MILDLILQFFCEPIISLLDSIPDLEFIRVSITPVFRWFHALNIFLPLDTAFNCLKMVLSFEAVKITMAIIVRIKSFIPTMGS